MATLSALSVSSFSDECIKLAKTRYEKEIERGAVRRADVVPGAGRHELPSVLGAYQRKKTREALAAPAERSASSLARKRQMSGKLYETQMRVGGPGDYKLVDAMMPGGGPATIPEGLVGRRRVVMAPREGGAFVRRFTGGPIDKYRAIISSVGAGLESPMYAPLVENMRDEDIAKIRGATGAALGKPKAVDPTLTHAVMRHELGEAGAFDRAPRHFASHAGPRPILEENLALRGDPEAQKIMGKLRGAHPDDELMQRVIRQAGGTPDAPLPLGGRQERAVERMLGQRVHELTPLSRARAVQFAVLTGKQPGYLPPGLTVPTAEDIGKGVKKIGPEIREIERAIKAKKLPPREAVSTVGDAARKAFQRYRDLARFIRVGR